MTFSVGDRVRVVLIDTLLSDPQNLTRHVGRVGTITKIDRHGFCDVTFKPGHRPDRQTFKPSELEPAEGES